MMSLLNVGTRVKLIASRYLLDSIIASSALDTGGEYLIHSVDQDDFRQPYCLETLEGVYIVSSWVSRDMLEEQGE